MRSSVPIFARFVAVGLLSNALLYLIYLGLTGIGLAPVPVVSVMWALGIALTFTLNRQWTFGDTGAVSPAIARYVVLYASAYVINVLLLVVLTEHAGLPHQLIQGVLIVVIACGLFAAQRLWVFRSAER